MMIAVHHKLIFKVINMNSIKCQGVLLEKMEIDIMNFFFLFS